MRSGSSGYPRSEGGYPPVYPGATHGVIPRLIPRTTPTDPPGVSHPPYPPAGSPPLWALGPLGGAPLKNGSSEIFQPAQKKSGLKCASVLPAGQSIASFTRTPFAWRESEKRTPPPPISSCGGWSVRPSSLNRLAFSQLTWPSPCLGPHSRARAGGIPRTGLSNF